MTVLNPSNSASDVNMTAIRLILELGTADLYDITTTEPTLPVLVRIGEEKTLKCSRNWSNFTGETVRIEAIAENTSIKSHLYTNLRFLTTLVSIY